MIQSSGKTSRSYSHRCLNTMLLSVITFDLIQLNHALRLMQSGEAARRPNIQQSFRFIIYTKRFSSWGNHQYPSFALNISRICTSNSTSHKGMLFLHPTPRAADSSFLYFPNRAENRFSIPSFHLENVKRIIVFSMADCIKIIYFFRKTIAQKLCFPIDILHRRHAPSDDNRTEYTRIKHVMNISLKIDFTMRLAVCIYALRSSPDGLQFICIIIFKLPQESVLLVIIQILSSALHLRQSE